MAKTKRNPRIHPLPGDELVKSSGHKQLRRVVVDVEISGHWNRETERWESATGFHVVYRDHHDREKRIWCTTWENWAKLARIVVHAKGKFPPKRK